MDRELLLERFGPFLKASKRYWPLAAGGLFIVIAVVSIGMCITGGKSEAPIHRDTTPRRLTLRCPMFTDGGQIPALYIGPGRNISPPLEFLGAPEETRQFALVMRDASDDAIVYWVAYRLPASATGVGEGVGPEPTPALLAGGVQGMNSFGTMGYRAPDPGDGTRRFRLTLYALGEPLPETLAPGLAAEDVMPHVRARSIAEATLTGAYRR